MCMEESEYSLRINSKCLNSQKWPKTKIKAICKVLWRLLEYSQIVKDHPYIIVGLHYFNKKFFLKFLKRQWIIFWSQAHPRHNQKKLDGIGNNIICIQILNMHKTRSTWKVVFFYPRKNLVWIPSHSLTQDDTSNCFVWIFWDLFYIDIPWYLKKLDV